MALAQTAYEGNDAVLMAKVIALAAQISDFEKEEVMSRSLRGAIGAKSVDVLNYLIPQGADVKKLRAIDVSCGGQTSKEVLEILLAHGWDINTCDQATKPFMWYIVGNGDMVIWCLEHGASVHPRDQEPLRDDILTLSQRSCPPILEYAASWATVATFELLRATGAPLGWRPLHLAVETATYPYIDRDERNQQWQGEGEKAEESEKVKEGVNPANTYAERMAMVRHLIDVVGLDVNAPDQPPGTSYGDRRGNPLCYVATTGSMETDLRELTWFLLDRGADPSAALVYASAWEGGNTKFVHAVEEWRVRQAENGSGKCCLQ